MGGLCDKMSLGNALEDLCAHKSIKVSKKPHRKELFNLFISVVLNLFLFYNSY